MEASNFSSAPSACDSGDAGAVAEVCAHDALAVPPCHPLPFAASHSYAACGGLAAAALSLMWSYRYFGRRLFPTAHANAKTESKPTKKGHDGRLLSRIHGKWYDLTVFEHPGGPVALGLAKGRDATALFESHHYFIPRRALLQSLAKYEVALEEARQMTSLDDRDAKSPYDWESIDQDAFAADLRGLLVAHFSPIAKERGVTITQATKATPRRWLLVWTLLAAFFASVPAFVRGSWICLVLTPLLAWLAIVNYFHDATHFALSRDWRLNALLPYVLPLLSSPHMWYHHHVIGHHAYTNIARLDPDLAHAPQLMREHASVRWRPSHAGQARWHRLLLVWAVAAGLGLNLLNDARATLRLSYNNVVPCERPTPTALAAHLAGRVLYVCVAFAWPFAAFAPWKALVWATVPNAVFSLAFMLNTQINHLTDACAHAGDANFYKHQVVTAQNFGAGSAFCYYFSGGLNHQIEHHLFPTVNHCHLPALSAGVRRVCRRHGVRYQSAAGYREALADHYAHTAAMAKRPE